MCSRQRKKRKKFVITKEITFRLKEIVICVINVLFSLSYLRRSLSHSLCSFIVLFEFFYGSCILFYEGQKGESIRVDDRFAPFSFMFPSQNIDTGGSSLLNIEKIEELFYRRIYISFLVVALCLSTSARFAESRSQCGKPNFIDFSFERASTVHVRPFSAFDHKSIVQMRSS